MKNAGIRMINIGFAIGVLEGLLISTELTENQKKAIIEAIEKLNTI